VTTTSTSVAPPTTTSTTVAPATTTSTTSTTTTTLEVGHRQEPGILDSK
jgi:hypothetical protein